MPPKLLSLIVTVLHLAVLLPTGPPVVHAATDFGTPIADFKLPDHLGAEHSLEDFRDSRLLVVVFLGTECPLAKLYSGRLQALADEYAEQGIAVVAIDSNRQDSLAEIAAFVRQHNLKYPVLKDRTNAVADKFGAERTPHVFLLDASRRVRYQGRVDDQYVVGIVRDSPTREDLRIAIDELLAGELVSKSETEPLGCIIGRMRETKDDSPVTYSRDIAPLLQSRCVECHREGEIGPFELTSYDEAVGWGEMIAEVVRDRRMPPWHADPAHGKFANNRSMTDEEKQLIYQWVNNGCPEGDAAHLPEPRVYTTGWQLPREPDEVFSMPEPFTVPARAGPSGVPYQYIRVPTGFTEERWIAATEVQPGNRSVVHHTIVYVEPPGGRGRRDWILLSAYVPGLRYDSLPDSSAKRIPAGSTLIFEQHYTPVGSVQQDATSIGLLYADEARIEQEVITVEIVNAEFSIPPRVDHHSVTATSRPVEEHVT
ncbi:MAG: redoxin domain-containing protein, partial [Aeoliella sp.]